MRRWRRAAGISEPERLCLHSKFIPWPNLCFTGMASGSRCHPRPDRVVLHPALDLVATRPAEISAATLFASFFIYATNSSISSSSSSSSAPGVDTCVSDGATEPGRPGWEAAATPPAAPAVEVGVGACDDPSPNSPSSSSSSSEMLITSDGGRPAFAFGPGSVAVARGVLCD